MRDQIAYCGLACDACPIYWATVEQDTEKKCRIRIATSRVLSKLHGHEMEWKAITDCDGCRSGGDRLFSWCYHCPVRLCAREKQYYTCAECIDYPCDELEKIFKSDPAAHSRLEVIAQMGEIEPDC